MYCLLCGYDVIELRRDVCPSCVSQDSLVPFACDLAYRCKKSPRDTNSAPMHDASVSDAIGRRIAIMIARNSTVKFELAEDQGGEKLMTRRVGFAQGGTGL